MRSSTLLAMGALTLSACATPPPPPAAIAAPAGAQAIGWQVPQLPAPAPIAAEEYQARRAALAARMEDGVLIVLGGGEPAADYLPYGQ